MPPKAGPTEAPIQNLEVIACAAPADLMRPAEPEPDVPVARDQTKGLQPDELYDYARNLAEWGNRGWTAFGDWQERERSIGACVKMK